MNKLELAHYFDHTNLKAFSTETDIKKLCDEAKMIHAYSVCVNGSYVSFCKDLLKDSDIKVCCVVGFPLGQNTIKTKAFEAACAIDDGANEIDYVLNVAKVKMHDQQYIEQEMETMTALCHESNVKVKVIFENCYLEKDEILMCAKIATKVRPDFIKTSTGFGTSGATYEDVKLMADTVGNQVKVKAAGGIRDLETCLKMIDAGASRIGISASLKVLNEMDV